MQTLSHDAYLALRANATVLERDLHGEKVLQLTDGSYLKLFRRKRLISSATWYPYAQRFADNALALTRRGIPCPRMITVYRIPGIARDAAHYWPLAGQTLRQLVKADQAPDALRQHLFGFVERLHAAGIYFRSLHLGNVVLTPDGRLGLIDIADMRLQSRPLFNFQRRRNLRHLYRSPQDKQWLEPDAQPAGFPRHCSDPGTATPLLSIVVPAYNYGHTLLRCLDSVLRQWQDGIEIIVVDDGSTDDTATVIGSLTIPEDRRFQYVRQENRGAAAARNHGLTLSQGEYVMLLDADDALLPGAVSAICSFLHSRSDADLLIGGQVTVRGEGHERVSGPDTIPASACRRLADYLVRRRISISHGSFVARRALLMERMYPESLPKREDIPVFAYLLARARVASIDHPLVRIFKHADSLRHRKFTGDQNPENLVEEVFRALPADCLHLRPAYAGLRYQSAARSALRNRQWKDARHYWLASFCADFRQALHPAQLRKLLRAAVGNR